VEHCDDDVLALVALGERPSDADAEHLTGCPRCRSEIESFRRVVVAGRPGVLPGPDVAPPIHVWDAVAAATGVVVRPRPVNPISAPDGIGGLLGGGGVDGPAAHTPVSGARDGSSDSVTRLRPRRTGRSRRRWLPMAAVAASALVVGGIAGAVGASLLGGDDPQAVVVARTTLDPLPADPGATGTAVVVNAAGTRRLEVDVSRLSSTDGFYEVWLIDASVKKMVPIGVLTGTRGDFTIPADLDLGKFPVVDISAEPLDGDPTHSGKSHLRGVIRG